ncbi:MAG: PfaD family polyunsaturated fatty acid/polyketide biosynthesis protein [Deltaproteobacteria bacterium]|nr:MAG: PfaD family polyunsaturated fatty acid/polyketide biosynthesis protein [Deltaproteobacteria bacterium]
MSDRIAAILSRYPATSVVLSTGEQGTGPGGLVEAVDAHGVGPLAAMLADGEELCLDDPGVRLVIRREGHGASVRVQWQDGPSFEERLELPEAMPAPAPDGARDAASAPAARPVDDLAAALLDLEQPLAITDRGVFLGTRAPGSLRGLVPPVSIADLGAASFRRDHGVAAALVAGAMAGGIASVDLVVAMSRAGMLAFFGSGGLPLDQVERAVAEVRERVAGGPAGFNLLHNPMEPAVEERTVDLYLAGGVRHVSASAYMRLTPAVVRYRTHGIHLEGDRIVAPNRVFAKVSRPEVAEQFMRPPPEAILAELVAAGVLTPEQRRLAARIPVAEDVTVEGDSGGHTDRRPLVAMVPVIRRLRDRIVAEEGYADRGIALRVGAAGGLGDPASVHAAFALGADYVLTGSVNQCTVEAGTSDLARELLARAGIADCTTGPAPDMFEMGAEVQVLGRGSMYAQRAGRLYELYRRYDSLDAIPAPDRARIEKQIFRRSLDEVWADTAEFWRQRDPAELARAEADPHHKMALTFRWYLGMTSRWARTGEPDRKRDFQIWCGPAMGLFNDWVAGTWLEPLPARGVVAVNRALLHGAAVLRRVDAARAAGLDIPRQVDPPGPWRAP